MRRDNVSSLLHALDVEDWMRVRDGVEALEEPLRARAFDEADLSLLAERLTALASHPKWEVRRAVARTARYLRHEAHRSIVERLLKDTNARVRTAAEDTREHRTERARIDLLPENADERMEGLLKSLEANHGPRAREAAMRVGRAYTEFMVRALSHEITAAMTPLANSIELLVVSLQKAGMDSQTSARHIDTSRERLRHLSAIVKATHAYVTDTSLDYRQESVRALVDEAASIVTTLPLALKNGVDLSVEVDAALRVEAHAGPLVQVFTNLLKNAIEASSERSPIPLRVTAKRAKGMVEVTVADQGVGMTDEDMREAVRPFRSRKPGGMGLGLPLVKKLVESEHRGVLRIESTKGSGTRITVALPISQDL